MFRIFKEFVSHLQAYQGDVSALVLNVVGGMLVGITFFVIGIFYLIFSNKEISVMKRRIGTLFGLFFLSCSFSRFLSVLCTWHNYAILDGWIKILTGLLAFFAILYLPAIIKQEASERKLIEAQEALEKTQRDLHEVRRLSEKLTDNK